MSYSEKKKMGKYASDDQLEIWCDPTLFGSGSGKSLRMPARVMVWTVNEPGARLRLGVCMGEREVAGRLKQQIILMQGTMYHRNILGNVIGIQNEVMRITMH